MHGSGGADGPVCRNPSCRDRHGGASGPGTGRSAGQRPLHRSPHAGRDRAMPSYFSLVTFATLGYGNIVLAPDYRIFGALRATCGSLMLGWST